MTIFSHILIFLAVFVISLLLMKAVIALSHRFSLYDYPGKHKRHKAPTPNLGGVAIFASFWGTIGLTLLLKIDILPEMRASIPYIFAGSLIIFFTGLVDDLKPLYAWPKLLSEVVAGVILYFGGLSITLLSVPGAEAIRLGGFAVVITVLWVVSLSNAINLIDGLDGLAAGISTIALVTMGLIGTLLKIDSVVVISLILLAAVLAFWLFNRYPARLFLGDCGSLLVGYFFAVTSLIVPIKSFTTAALFVPLIVLGVPLTETASSFLRRLVAGKNVMKADRRHIFHYLAHAGLSQRRIVYLFYLLGVIFSVISITMIYFERTLVMTLLILFMVVIFIIYFIFISKIRKERQPADG